MSQCDLLALNQDETAALAGIPAVKSLGSAERCARQILEQYPHLKLWLTVGPKGSISADKSRIRQYETFPVKVRNTAGAGDATLAGIIAGLALGMPFHRLAEDTAWGCAPIGSAAEFGAVVGGLSVTSEDSIDLRINPSYVKDFLNTQGWEHTLSKYW